MLALVPHGRVPDSAGRSLDVGDGEKLRDADPLARGHLIALLLDLYGVH
jgi:hypothetical protein